jgi:hypothetical protein
MNNPLAFGDFEFLPKPLAIERRPELAESIITATQRFCTGYQFPDDEHKFTYMNGAEVPVYPQLTRPTILFLRDGQSVEDARAAIAMIAFATMSAMDVGGLYANSLVFESRLLKFGGGERGFAVEESRRVTGGVTNAYATNMRIETRPQWCGQFLAPDEAMLEALLCAQALPDGMRFRNALSALSLATMDTSYVPVEIERSFFALVVTHLLSGISTDDDMHAHLKALSRILSPKVQGGAQNLLDVYRSSRLNRAGTWHPNPRTSAPYDFEQQTLVPLGLIYFRLVDAVVIALLVDANCLDANSKLAAKVSAINAWIDGISALNGETFKLPTTGAEFIALKERYESVASISAHWSKVHLDAIIRNSAVHLGVEVANG